MTRAGTFLVSVLAVVAIASEDASSQRRPLQWEFTGGPQVGARDVIAQANGLLLVGPAWRSLDDGATWHEPPPPFRGQSMMAAVEGELVVDTPDGLFRTSDLGDSSTRCGQLPIDRTIGRVVRLITADGPRVYVTIERVGLFRSRDKCATWTAVVVPWPADTSAQPFTVNGRVVVGVTIPGVGARTYLSPDDGDTWVDISSDLRSPLIVVEACNNGLLAGTTTGVYRSLDGGRRWTSIGLEKQFVRELAEIPCGQFLATVPGGSVTPSVVMRSVDGGSSWAPIEDGPPDHSLQRFRAGRDGTVYATGGGVFRRRRQAEWEQLGPGTAVVGLIATPWGKVIASTEVSVFEADSGGPWRRLRILPEDKNALRPFVGGPLTIGLAGAGDLLVRFQSGLARSRDRGRTWQRGDLTKYVEAFATLTDGSVLAGTDDGIFRSADGGETWTERSIGLSSFRITALAAGPDRSAFAAAGEKIYSSTDGGDRWQSLESWGGPVRALLRTAGGILLAGSGYGLARWDAKSRSWLGIPIPLGNGERPPTVQVLLQDGRGTLYAATTLGIFSSTDDGRSWLQEPGPGGGTVKSLVEDRSGRIYAATQGGVWFATVGP